MNRIPTVTFENWHAWQGVAGPLLSDENSKRLMQFDKPDNLINWLFMNGDKAAARAFNKAFKECI